MKNAKRLLSLLLVLSLVLSVAPITTWAAETKTETPAAAATTEANETEEINLSTGMNVLLLKTEGVEIDETDPAIIAVKAELNDMMVLGAEGDPVPLTEAQKQEVLYLFQQYLDHWAANANILGAQTPFFLSFNDTRDELGVLGEMLVMAGVSVDVVRAGYMTYDDLTGMIQNFYFGDALGVALYGEVIAADREAALKTVRDSGARTTAQKLLVLNDWLAHNATFDMTYIMNSGKDEDKKPMIAENPQKHQYYDVVYGTIYDEYEKQIQATFESNIVNGLKAEMEKQFYIAAIQQVVHDQAVEAATPEIEKAIYDQAYQAAYEQYMTDHASENPTEEDAAAYADAAADAAVEAQAETIKTEAAAAADKAVEDFMAENGAAVEADPKAFVQNAWGTEAAEGLAAQWEQTWADWEANGIPGMVAQIKLTAYQSAIKDALVQNGQSEAAADAFLEANAEAITADPYAFCVQTFGQNAADQFESGINSQLQSMGIDTSAETNPQGRVSLQLIVAMQMDTPQQDPMLQKPDGSYMTPNEAIPLFAEEAALGLTGGVLDYWEGSHIGVLGDGYGVCLGYTKAFTYLVQCMNADIYTTNGDYTVAANWKSNKDLYYTNGELDINKGYIVDTVRITFDASVTMFGETEDNFNSDHFWNAVRVDGQWYYIDPCYNDVYGEVMMRDRVETDGYMNHLYFLFSHDTTVELYDGNYKEIKTLYETAANDKGYEDSWFSRIKSNTYSDGVNFYYFYDSSDMVSMMAEFENMDMGNTGTEGDEETTEFNMNSNEYKLVYHPITSTDKKGNEEDEVAIGDTDYTTLIEFNYTIESEEEDVADETVARVRNASGEMVENELLTELYAEHSAYTQIYPALAICTALYNNRLYFNLSNCILYYDMNSYEVVLVKEYNSVSGQRDKTNAFGGMAFTICDEDEADFTVGARPIAGMTIKADGNMYVSVATNFAFISGKETVDDQTSYGYEFEETNYNAGYSNFGGDSEYSDMMEDMGYDTDDNDNDEFMWTANFVETLSMSHLNGSSHNYATVTVAATCTDDGFSENRCTTCGKIQANSRLATDEEAHDHHYIRFDEVYYTNAKDGTTNTGFCYICTHCYDAQTEPQEPQDNDMYEDYGTSYEEQMAEYEKNLAAYNEIVANAGHTYAPTDAQWDTDNATVTFQNLKCTDDCIERKDLVDHLIADDKAEVTLQSAYTAAAEVVDSTGSCTDGGITVHYRAAGEVDGCKYDLSHEYTKPVGEHNYTIEWTWTENRQGGYDATVTAVCSSCDTAHEDVEATVTRDSASVPATCTATGVNIYNASANVDGVVLTATKSVDLEFLPHDLDDGICTDCNAGRVYRYYGSNRSETAIEVAEAMRAALDVNTFDAIILASGDSFADALAGSYLSAKKNAPILLHRASAAQTNLDYILENLSNDGIVYLLGGTAAIPAEVEQQLKDARITVKRLYGNSRFATNLAILEEAGVENGQEILVCTGWNFADSLSASATGMPILLVNNNTGVLTDEQIAFLKAHEDSKLTIIGGTSAVSIELATALTDYAYVERCYGDSRYLTSVAVAERYFQNPNAVVLAYAQNFPDGLCGGALAYTMGAPLILTDSNKYEIAAEYAVENDVAQGAVLGGKGLVSDEAVVTVFSMTDEMIIRENRQK